MTCDPSRQKRHYKNCGECGETSATPSHIGALYIAKPPRGVEWATIAASATVLTSADLLVVSNPHSRLCTAIEFAQRYISKDASVKPYGSRPAARQIVKMATGMATNLNSACATCAYA